MRRGPKPGKRSRHIVALFLSGMEPVEIAHKVGCSRPFVYSVLHRQGIWRNRPDIRPLARGEHVIQKLHRAGLSQKLIAKLLEVSPTAIHKALRRARSLPTRGQIVLAARNRPRQRSFDDITIA